MNLVWSIYQKAIFEEVENGTGHSIISAYAGSSKTTSIIESLKYIPRGKNVLLCAFNKSTATALQERAGNKTYITISTLHSVGFKAIKEAFGSVVLDTNKCRLIVNQFIDEKDFDLNNCICQCVSLCKATLSFQESEIQSVIDQFSIETGDLEEKDFIKIVSMVIEKCKEQKNIIDFDDMIFFPCVFKLKLKTYDIVFIDEIQDLNKSQFYLVMSSCKKGGRIIGCGDEKQCVDVNTTINTGKNENKLAKDLVIGDQILSYRNGKNCYQKISGIFPSTKTSGLKIITKSENSLILTKEHQIWASLPSVNNNKEYLVYLMYRDGFGFRVGMTNKGFSVRDDNGYNITNRLNQEQASLLWILDFKQTYEQAHLKEISYSLKYGIPTAVFNGHNRKLNQNHINALFSEFGNNGFNLLKDKCMSFELPNVQIQSSFFINGLPRTVVNFTEHSKRGSVINVEWTESHCNFNKILLDNNVSFSKAKCSKNHSDRFRIRKWFSKNNDALIFAEKISRILNIRICRTLSNSFTDDKKISLINASSLHVGMQVVSNINNKPCLDEIISIENVSSEFLDIEVDDSSNFYGNNILSHNCIYGFRAADGDIFNIFKDKLKAKELSLPISYRCPRKIVYMAQKFVPKFQAAPNAKDGTIHNVLEVDFLDKVQPGDFILSRTNAPLIKYCLALLRRKIPANIAGKDIGKSLSWFIKKSKKKTVKSLIAYIEKWRETEINRVRAAGRDTSQYEDKAECLLELCDEVNTIDELMKNIVDLFNDVEDNNKVILSTVHKSKGLERERVHLLEWTFRHGVETKGPEANIRYVAITRAKSELFLISKTSKYNKFDSPIKDSGLSKTLNKIYDENEYMSTTDAIENIHCYNDEEY